MVKMDFARVLLVGVVIFAVLLVFFGGEFGGLGGNGGGSNKGYHFGPVESPSKQQTEKAKGEKLPEEAFFVGKRAETDFKYFTLSENSFSISFKEDEIILGSLEETRIEKGFMADKSQTITFNLTRDQVSKISSLSFSLYVDQTNSFGKLLVDLNGKRIYSKFVKPERHYAFEANESLLKENNKLKIHAQSSGSKFWAPAIYILKNFTARAKVLGRERKTFEFDLGKQQADNFRSGRLILYPEKFKPREPLAIQVNGRDVYRKITPMPGRPNLWIDFEDADVKQGTNKLTFLTGYNSSYKFRSGRMIIFWNSETSRITTRTVEVSSSQRNRLPGEITFKIERIEGSPGSLNLNIVKPGGDEKKILIQEVLKEGKTISIELTKNDVGTGENEIQFIVEGTGGFYLSDFDVNY